MSKFDDAYLRMQQFGGAMLGRLADSKGQIDRIRARKVALPSGCPSRASAIDTLYLSKIGQDLQEVMAAMKEMREEIWRGYGD